MARFRKKQFTQRVLSSGQCRLDVETLLGGIGIGGPRATKNELIQIIQLTYDGMIRQKGKWSEKNELLEWLMDFGVKHVGDYYRNCLRSRRLVGQIKERTREILRYSLRSGKSKNQHLTCFEEEIFRSVYDFQKLEGEEILQTLEIIVPIASEGFEPAFLLGSIYGEAKIFPARYSRINHGDSSVKIPNEVPRREIEELIKGRKVMVVEGTISTGKSLNEVCEWAYDESPTSLEFSCVLGDSRWVDGFDREIRTFARKGSSRRYGKYSLLD